MSPVARLQVQMWCIWYSSQHNGTVFCIATTLGFMHLFLRRWCTQALSGCQNSHYTTENGKASALRELHVARSEVLHYEGGGGGGGGGVRPDVICLTRGGICRMWWDVLMLSVATGRIAPLYLWMPSAAVAKRERPRASSKCSLSGCHTASTGTMMECVWTLSHKLTKRGHRAWSRGWFTAGWKEWWQRPWW